MFYLGSSFPRQLPRSLNEQPVGGTSSSRMWSCSHEPSLSAWSTAGHRKAPCRPCRRRCAIGRFHAARCALSAPLLVSHLPSSSHSKGHDGVVAVLADRKRCQLIVGDLPNVDFRLVDRVRRTVRPSGEAVAPECFERFRIPTAHVPPVSLFLFPYLLFRRTLLRVNERAESDN